jgi:hypothetical protein
MPSGVFQLDLEEAMHRSRPGQSRPRSRPEPAGSYARYAPRIIGLGMLVAAVIFIVIGLVTA